MFILQCKRKLRDEASTGNKNPNSLVYDSFVKFSVKTEFLHPNICVANFCAGKQTLAEVLH